MWPKGCRARGRAPLTAARHQNPGCPARDDKRLRRAMGCGAIEAAPGTSCLESRTGKHTGKRGGIQLGKGVLVQRLFSLRLEQSLLRPPGSGAGVDEYARDSLGFRSLADLCARRGCNPAPRPTPPPAAAGSRGPSAFPGRRAGPGI